MKTDPIIIDKFTEVPIKKCKLDDKTRDKYQSWTLDLNERHKEKIEKNEWICSDIINSVHRILSYQFQQINGFQLTNLAPIYDDSI